MNKTKMIIGFVFICIALSFFSICYAAGDQINASYLAITGHNGNGVLGDDNIDVVQSSDGKETQVKARFSDSNFTITPAQTGLYAIGVTTMQWNVDREIGDTPRTYNISIGGKYLRIPAVKTTGTSGADTYTLYSNYISPNKGNTSVVVWLTAGSDYKVNFVGRIRKYSSNY